MTSRRTNRAQCQPPYTGVVAEPPDLTPISLSSDGDVLSYYADQVWDLSPFHTRHVSINFAPPANSSAIAITNARLFKRIVYFWLHERARPLSATTISSRHATLKHLVNLCNDHDIPLTDIGRYPTVLLEIFERVPASTYAALLNVLRELGIASRRLGFAVLSHSALHELQRLQRDYHSSQSPYIPERIYSHIIERCQGLIADYLTRRDAFEALYREELSRHLDRERCSERGKYKELVSVVAPILGRWLGSPAMTINGTYSHPRALSKFLTAVRFAGHAMLIAFSGMRTLEALSLTTSCLQVDSDPLLGQVYMLRGRTTKTIRDSEAIWITSRQVCPAIEAMTSIARLRARAALQTGRAREGREKEVLLSIRTTDPWIRAQRGDVERPARATFGEWYLRCPLLLIEAL